MPRSRDNAMDTLGPLLDDLYAATVRGVRSPRRDYVATSHIHRKTTNRSIVRDQIVYDLRGRVDGRPGVRILNQNQTTYFLVKEEFQLLVKMSDEHGEVTLNDNQTSFDFQCNKQPDLFDFELTNLYLSYVDNQADPDNPSVLIVCPNASGVEWMIEIEPPASGVAGEIAWKPDDDDEDDLVRVKPIAKPEEDAE